MKGAAPVQHKRGWRVFWVPVLSLVLLSLLVPLFFLVNQSGYSVDDRGSNSFFKHYDRKEHGETQHHEEEEQHEHSKRVKDLIRSLETNDSRNTNENFVKDASTQNVGGAVSLTANSTIGGIAFHGRPITPQSTMSTKPQPTVNMGKIEKGILTREKVKRVIADETQKSCQLEFGSYCLWRDEHREEMKDSVVKRLKDQLFVARAYYPSVVKIQSQAQEKLGHGAKPNGSERVKLQALAQDTLSREMKLNIQDFERMLSEATTDADLPPDVSKKILRMDSVISKAKLYPVDCNNVDKKFRQLVDLTEDEAHFHMKQSAFLYQLAVQTMPKSLHCLSMRLTVEYFKSQEEMGVENFQADNRQESPAQQHYVIFSNLILAASVVINSSVMHSEATENQVYHVITNGQNYFAMKFWFRRNTYKNATVNVLNVEELDLNQIDGSDSSQLFISGEFRVSLRNLYNTTSIQMRTEYLSVFGSMHFLLPKIFPNLKKVVVLSEDVVIQKDLSALWNIDMEGKVNAAVEFCSLRLGELKGYLGQNDFDSNGCAWMSGMNVVDLERWREENLTEAYWKYSLNQMHNEDKVHVAAWSLPANLLTFRGLIHALDSSWALSGLGYKYGIDSETIAKATVLHYNGNMKPWLELGIPNYKRYWKRFLKRDDQFMDDCNVNP